ncbi:hypothetical protein [Streptomyces sp. NPDC094468]|uniref:hypothetical protein n=1 Tax=Streptomyces sp. NPDC094468 TaxID=3366066 RepID=UPI00382F82CA
MPRVIIAAADLDRVRTAADAPRLKIDHTGDRGEWCGRVLSEQDVAEGERFSRHDDHSLEKALLGQDEDAVKRALAAARD